MGHERRASRAAVRGAPAFDLDVRQLVERAPQLVISRFAPEPARPRCTLVRYRAGIVAGSAESRMAPAVRDYLFFRRATVEATLQQLSHRLSRFFAVRVEKRPHTRRCRDVEQLPT